MTKNPEQETKTASRRVLIVDDNLGITKTLSLLVKHMGHQPKAVNSGKEALAIGEEFQPEVILLDLGMPQLDGYETAEKIRQTDWGKSVTLIALTGWGNESDKDKTKAASFDQHLVKPPEPADLRNAINS